MRTKSRILAAIICAIMLFNVTACSKGEVMAPGKNGPTPRVSASHK